MPLTSLLRVVVLALLACAFSVQAEPALPSAGALLQQMQRAYRHYTFELSMVRVRQGSVEPIRFSHAVVGSQQTDSLHLSERSPQ